MAVPIASHRPLPVISVSVTPNRAKIRPTRAPRSSRRTTGSSGALAWRTNSFQDCLPRRTLDSLMAVLRSRRSERPDGSYSARLFEGGTNRILKKIGEEATEVVIAAGSETRERLVSEVADLVFHLSVLLVEKDLNWGDIGAELRKRQ